MSFTSPSTILSGAKLSFLLSFFHVADCFCYKLHTSTACEALKHLPTLARFDVPNPIPIAIQLNTVPSMPNP